jgi:Arc/MetJ-type ribon-helix-helix transcriptional regulator
LHIALHNGEVADMPQLVTRIDDGLAQALDELIEAGVFSSRSEAVRAGLQELVDRHRRDLVGRRIRAGYEAKPQSEEESGWADSATIKMIADEPG